VATPEGTSAATASGRGSNGASTTTNNVTNGSSGGLSVWVIVLCIVILLLVLVIVALAVKVATRKDDGVVLVAQAHAVDGASDVPTAKEAWGEDGDVTAVAVDDDEVAGEVDDS
jgi:hypothetical protein